SGDSAVVKLDASGTTGSGSDQGRWQVGGTCPSDGFLGRVSSSSNGVSVATPLERSASDTGGTVKEIGSNGGGAFNLDTATPTELCLSGDLSGAVPFGLLAYSSGSAAPETGPISIDVVREGGRWFVSPVTTVLHAIDATIQHVDKRSIYTLLGIAYEL